MDTGKPPLMIASYLPTRPGDKIQEHLIELSNLPKQDIGKKAQHLVDRTGRYVSQKKWKNTETLNYSLQGRWFPGIWNKKISHTAIIETHRHVPSEWDYVQTKRPFQIRNTYKAKAERRKRLMRHRL